MENNNEEKWEKIEAGPSETWDFKKTPELIGYFIEKEEGVGEFGSNVYSFKKEDGGIIGVWGNTILDSRFKNIETGEKIKIVYKGMVKSEKGRSYNDFDVFRSKKVEIVPETSEEEIISVIEEKQ